MRNMGINFGGFTALVSQQFLDIPKINPFFQ